MALKTLVGTPDRSFESLLVDVAEEYIVNRGEIDQKRANLQQALFLATYYAHHERPEGEAPYILGDIAFIPMIQHGFRRAATRAGKILPGICGVNPPYEGEMRDKLLRISRRVHRVTAQTLVGVAPEDITCGHTQGYDFFARKYSNKETDPKRKAEIIDIIKNGYFTIPRMGGVASEE